jgi:hypothetical protein
MPNYVNPFSYFTDHPNRFQVRDSELSRKLAEDKLIKEQWDRENPNILENLKARLLRSRAARTANPTWFDLLLGGKTRDAQAASRVKMPMPIRGPQEAPLASRLAIPRTVFPAASVRRPIANIPARVNRNEDFLEPTPGIPTERIPATPEWITKMNQPEFTPEGPGAPAITPSEETSTADYQAPPEVLNAEKKGFFARLAQGWEGMDEDKKKNLALALLAGSLHLMGSQKYTTVPHSPVAEVGEAGLGGLQTYVSLSEADRKAKLVEQERARKELRDLMTARHQKQMEGFEAERLGYKRPGGIDWQNLMSQIGSRKDTTPVNIWDEASQTFQEVHVPNNLLKFLPPNIKPTETVGQKVWNAGEGTEEVKRISKFARGTFPQMPESKIVTGTSGEEKKTIALERGPNGTYRMVPIMSGKGPSEASAANKIQMANAEKYYRTEIKDILSRANITMTPNEAIQFSQLSTENIGAFMAAKTRTLPPAEKAKVDTALRSAFDRYNLAVAPIVGKQVRPEPPKVTVDFDQPLTFK